MSGTSGKCVCNITVQIWFVALTATFLLSLPERSAIKLNKLWSIVHCKCNEIGGFKQCNESENIVTIDFQDPTVCITPNTDFDRCVLTHLYISFVHKRKFLDKHSKKF